MAKVLKFFGLLGGTLGLLLVLHATEALVFDARQIASIVIFSMFIYGTLLFGEFRLAFAFGGIGLLMGANLITVERFTQAADLDVLIFLIGTFLVIGYLEENQFFEHVVSAIVQKIGPRPQTLLIVLMVMASIFSALVGEVTAILFMSGAMLHLTNKYRLNPVPFIIMLVFACNNGSAMSSVGNPIGVLIALKTGLSFVDFLLWAAPVAMVVDVATFFICRWWFADSFTAFAEAVSAQFETHLEQATDRRDALLNCLDKLDGRKRDLVTTYYASARETGEMIASKLSMSPNALRQSLFRIRRVLVDCVERTVRAEARQ